MRALVGIVIVGCSDPPAGVVLEAVDDGVGLDPDPAFSAAATATPPVYCASIGQIGWQLLAPQQAGRPS
jgi:hypothetical protein